MVSSLMQAKEVTKKYKRFSLGPLDMEVEPGIVIGLIGSNGSGKSTLLRVLMDVLKRDSGHIKFFGQEWHEDDVEWKQKVGYAGEILDAYGFLTVGELKDLISRWYPSWSNEQFETLVKRYKIDLKEKYRRCSKGTQKKIEFIFTLCHNPSLLLLDEPTAGVDIVSQRKMKEDLLNFMEDGEKAIVLATHTVDEINSICDEIVVLESGRIIHSFNKDEITENWARIWTSDIGENVKNHPNVIQYYSNPCQIVTNDLDTLEGIIQKEQITINHMQRLSLEEVLEFLIDN
ncbi:ABC transporter ATP-binding protein [Ornithinibacillus halophilus]|uniref:ABC-2 type transport system ATP-binding protein n=1 Tax=Ornithinibacillus halophilus TaxID=930117 RepID=A0A1M5IZL5_9BACI|nr:ABC transporter ATP-binding protein [Ornithinibacillus halophilus]SHG33746.1 ABC-2 type transport system ATP-binding protein [Ornithinibacillus halophilus]